MKKTRATFLKSYSRGKVDSVPRRESILRSHSRNKPASLSVELSTDDYYKSKSNMHDGSGDITG